MQTIQAPAGIFSIEWFRRFLEKCEREANGSFEVRGSADFGTTIFGYDYSRLPPEFSGEIVGFRFIGAKTI